MSDSKQSSADALFPGSVVSSEKLRQETERLRDWRKEKWSGRNKEKAKRRRVLKEGTDMDGVRVN